jgi:tRNA C32,U32 (ribose-2'-O)-methylase TrmJ
MTVMHSKAHGAGGPAIGGDSDDEVAVRQRLAQVRVVLVATTHPGNIGASARAMKAMGIRQLVLVTPRYFPHPEAVALASGADDVLDSARVVDSLADALRGTTMAYALSARRRELSHRALGLREAAAEAIGLCAAPHPPPGCPADEDSGALPSERPDAALEGPVAFVFGTEMSGLSNEELIACQALVHIPVDPRFSSLNLSQAVQLVAYELRLAAGGVRLPSTEPQVLARHEEVERLCEHLEETLLASGFLDPNAPRRLMERFRRLFVRARLEHEEVNILRGVLTSMRKWAEGNPKVRASAPPRR